MDRDPANARYCAECAKMHPAEEGDFWAESSMLGLKITYFAMMQGKVFDITGNEMERYLRPLRYIADNLCQFGLLVPFSILYD